MRQLHGVRRPRWRRARVAVDAAGLAQGAVSSSSCGGCTITQQPLPWRH